MALLVNAQQLSKAFGSQVLFEDLSFSIFERERIALIGPNGAGKSTLLKLLANLETPDEGEVALRSSISLAYVPQEHLFPDVTPLALVKESVDPLQAEIWLTKMGFSGEEKSAAHLSGGWKKRLAIALACATEPDVVLLDEPTNHLDVESIESLERLILREVPTCVVISHDRAFLHQVVDRVIEINPMYPEGLFSVKGNYQTFLGKKERFLQGEIEKERSIASKVKREAHWLKQSPKARTTKAQSRLDAAYALFQEHAALRKRNEKKRVTLTFEASERQTRKLLVGKNLGKKMGDNTLFEHVDVTLTAGTRLGLIGKNGSGKTTLMRLLAGELEPDQGTLKPADDLQVVYFDQARAQLPGTTTLKEALCPHGEFVQYREQTIHVHGWAAHFLFQKEQLTMPIEKLSGGERARIFVARLMLQKADILLLDEPTNDLDIETLETLEDNLQEYPGAVVLITHDRTLMKNVCTTFVELVQEASHAPPEKKKNNDRELRKERNRIEKKIEEKERELVELREAMEKSDTGTLIALSQEELRLKADIETLFEKWTEIEYKISANNTRYRS